jgi:lipopolysaccharide biosynthesis protein
MSVPARLIALYLPQFHPIPENDEWWGKGFTEWTNVVKATPLFKGHYQPRLPADLSYYDLRVPEVREAQAELARNAGIEGFCYYHYWFGGKRLLERPFKEVVALGKPDFPFCLCWANETWKGVWHGAPNRVLIEQTYPGPEDNRKHFMALRDAFLDERYLRIAGRPIFIIYRPIAFPRVVRFIEEWQELAIQNGLPGIHFIAFTSVPEPTWDFRSYGFDGCSTAGNLEVFRFPLRQLLLGANANGSEENLKYPRPEADDRALTGILLRWFWRRCRSSLGQFGNVLLYRQAIPHLLDGCSGEPGIHPTVVPNWDNTARSNVRGYVLHDSTPELFRTHLRDALKLVKSHPVERRLVFIKSWNEWAEGNYLEPDQKFGHEYLKVVREEVSLWQRSVCGRQIQAATVRHD